MQMGKDYYQQIVSSDYCHVILWMDQCFLTKEREYPIQGWLDDLNEKQYDKVVIALSRREDAEEAIALLKQQNIEENKIVWEIHMRGVSCL